MPAMTSSRKLLFEALAGTVAVVAVVVVIAVVVVATGRGGTPRAIGLRNIPLPAGTRVVAQVRSCDRGVHPYCAVQVVIVGDRYRAQRRCGPSTASNLPGWGGRPARAGGNPEPQSASPGTNCG